MSTTERTDPRDWNDGPDDRPLVVAESVSKVYSGGGSDVSAVEDFTLTTSSVQPLATAATPSTRP